MDMGRAGGSPDDRRGSVAAWREAARRARRNDDVGVMRTPLEGQAGRRREAERKLALHLEAYRLAHESKTGKE